jgi:hypothetical protein
MHHPFVKISHFIPGTAQEGNHVVAFKGFTEAITAIDNQPQRRSRPCLDCWIGGALGLIQTPVEQHHLATTAT